ncbi:MAG: DUF896 domain-containing protein [Butyricicoccaceae bacterium]
MDQNLVKRINELAKKAKTAEGLTECEREEQKQLRQQYLKQFRAGFQSQLDNIVLVDENGNRRPLKRKPYNGLKRH